jgi:glycolate oxidase FAD binding subunit
MAGYLIDGIRPRAVIEPPSPEAFAEAVRSCSSLGQSIVFYGGGSRQAWGRTPAAVDVAIATRGLGRILRYEPGDLTVSVEAGVRIRDLNSELALHGQMLPIDTSSDHATIGGAIATNDTGPLRHRYGSTRDQLIGIRLATADGKLASAGGNVVKNVAGYDLGKLVSGSFGTLAGIVSATFKLAPIPAATATLGLSFDNIDDLAGASAAVAGSQLDLMSFEVEAALSSTPPEPAQLHLFARFGGLPAVNAAQIQEAGRLAAVHNARSERAEGDAEQQQWRDRANALWIGEPALVRAAWLPANLGDVLRFGAEAAQHSGAHIQVSGRAAMGSGSFRVGGTPDAMQAAIVALRSRPDLVSHVVIAHAPASVKRSVDVWGSASSAAAVLASLKQTLDPAGVLNAGRGPI